MPVPFTLDEVTQLIIVAVRIRRACPIGNKLPFKVF
jgi:hypothetical protein